MAANPDINEVAQRFALYYYSKFDQKENNKREELVSLYRDESMLTWESNQILGHTAIMEKLLSLPFSKVEHRIVTLDSQPLPALPVPGGLCILITGELLVDDSEHPIKFSQLFNLFPSGSTYFIYNDVFRLNYG